MKNWPGYQESGGYTGGRRPEGDPPIPARFTIDPGELAPPKTMRATSSKTQNRNEMTNTVAARLVTFDTEDALHDYLESMNEKGLTPDLAIRDALGIQVLASRTAPGGDGCDFAYYSPDEDGFMHCCGCSECGPVCQERTPGWTPHFPVVGLASA